MRRYRELEDVRSALDGALARSEVVDGSELLANIYGSWRTVGLDAEGTARCEAYLTALPTSESRLRALLESVLSDLLSGSGHKVRAFDVATEAVEHAAAIGNYSLLARALRAYATAAASLTQFDDPEKALAQAEAIPGLSPFLRILLLGTRAFVSSRHGNVETAARMYEQLREVHRSLGDTNAEQSVALNLAEIEHKRGQTLRAIAIARETLPAVGSGDNKGNLATLLFNLAGCLAAVGDLAGAAAGSRESISSRAVGEPDHAHVAGAIEHLALVFALSGDRTRAATLEGYAHVAFGRHEFEREFTETTTHDRLTALLNEEMAPDELARLSAEGAALTPEAAIALALDEDEPDDR